MRKAILAVLAACGLAAGAAAQTPERWVYVGMRGGAMGWDVGAMTRDPAAGTLKVQRFTYFAEPMEGPLADYNWMLQDIELNCKANTFVLSGSVYLDEDRKKLDELEFEPDAPRPVLAGSPEGVMKAVLCDGATLSDALEASTKQAAMDGATKAALK